MFLVALVLAGQEAAIQPPTPQADVVITGNRMRDALEKCLARYCPPEEEVDAAMNAGAESFAAGRYKEARTILSRAISRNKKYAARMPGPISDLYATFADVTEHEGDVRSFRHATRESVYVLREALGRENQLALGASTRLADMWVKLNDVSGADSAYRGAAEEAARGGKTDLAAALTFRRAWLALSARNFARSRALLEQLERSHGKDARFVGWLRVLRLRIDIAKGNEAGTDDLVTALRGTGGEEPVLLYEPYYPEFGHYASPGFSPNGSAGIMSAPAGRSIGHADFKWADIGFWVRPDGRPAEIEILRPAKGGQWAMPLVKHIAARRYVPARQDADGIGAYRVERFTLRSPYGVATGTHMTQRTGQPTLHVVDLTKLAQRDDPPRP